MPNSLMMADANFPRFTGGESAEKKIEAIQSYLFQLTEQLRWAHANVGKENFNETEFKTISEEIQRPVIKRYESLDLTVENGDESSSIKITGEGLQTEAKTITFSGMVTFKALGEKKESERDFTLINGAYIQTGVIDTMKLYGNEISGGTIEGTEITGGTITGALYKCNLIDEASAPTGEIQMYYVNGKNKYSAGGLRLEYDKNVSENDSVQSRYRMRLYTKSNTHHGISLKLESGHRMSLEANGLIYIYTMSGGVTIHAPKINLDGNVYVDGTYLNSILTG